MIALKKGSKVKHIYSVAYGTVVKLEDSVSCMVEFDWGTDRVFIEDLIEVKA